MKRDKLDIINKILLWALLALGLYLWIFQGRIKFFVMGVLVSLASYFFAVYLLKRLDLNKPGFRLCINILLLTNIIGELYFYTHFFYFDKILHFFNPMLFAPIVAAYFAKYGKPKKFGVFLAALGVCALWEVFEYGATYAFSYPLMGVLNSSQQFLLNPLDDTMLDLTANCFGLMIFLFFSRFDKKK
jgi:hypothetical protein